LLNWKKRKQQLLKQQKELANNNAKALAVILHDYFCNDNHTDVCSWFYKFDEDKQHNWNGSAHARSLNQAKYLLTHSGMKADKIVDFLKVLDQSKRAK